MGNEESRALEVATTESAFRDANDRFRRALRSYRFEAGDRAPFLCECDDPHCFENVMMSLEEYDRVRTHPAWFVLTAGHEDAEAPHERIVEAEAGYAIVEKIGAAGTEAARLRRRDADRPDS